MLGKHLTCVALGVTLLLMLSHYPTSSEGSRILAIFAFPGKSHYGMHSALIKELVDRGHHVTMVAAYTLKHLNLGQNYTEILIEPVYDFWSDVKAYFKAETVFDLSTIGVLENHFMLEVIGFTTTEHALKQPKIQELINHPSPQGQYDLLLCEQFYQEPFLALAHIYNIPVVTSGTLGFENHMSQMMGLLSPWSFVPHGFTDYSDHMTFKERLLNSYYSLAEDFLREYHYFPEMDKMVQKYFGHLNVTIPPISQMEKNISVMLLNSHLPLITARPLVPGIVFVGGMHIYPPKKLPQDIQDFMDGAEDGVIFFSLGSNVQSKDMPDDKLHIFLDVFASMKQRIIWKFENESIPNLPENILIKKWLPQSDILAHPRTKVFITHGGLFGTQEGVHHGVPMLGIPFYCDQQLNLRKSERNGYAISLDFLTITHDLLRSSLEKLLYDPKYRENIQRYSRIFRDRPVGSRETAAYWIEYVIRHGGAPQLRSAGLDLEWYQFYLLDVIAFVVVVAVVVILVLGYIFKRLLCGVAGGSSSKKLKVN
ncbi:UDP-glycosyltransferase UGT5 isoform X1 [Musca domestica]|uniref:UDP-glucuronosyltransferase 2B9-like n=1 Tax=Musca domestica TaxID=7370 RepID=A0A1I8N3F5_MUSDO|nr:UDP-glycosyltransferase UGT5 isoform X2 [Musca domestica]XP_058976074.1 UDP-glycosyltransferase UGT5 isoform X1 [Musca domestica]